MDIKRRLDDFAHSYIYIGLIGIISLIFWYTRNQKIAYYCITFFLVLTPLLSKDAKTILAVAPFAMSCYQGFVNMSEMPFEMIITIIGLALSVIIYLVRNIKHIKVKFNGSIISYSLLLLALGCFIATVIRHIFYNQPAFPNSGYETVYNIKYGYLLSLIVLAMALFSLFISSCNDLKHQAFFSKVFFVFGLYLFTQSVIAVITKKSFDFKEIYPFIAWCEKNSMAIAIEMCLPFIACLYSKNFKRIDLLCLMAGLLFFVITGGSRGGQVTTIFMMPLLLYIVLHQTKHKYRNFITIMLLIGFIGFLSYFNIPIVKVNIDRLILKGLDVTGRDIFWKWIFDYTYNDHRHLLFGGSPVFLIEINSLFNKTFVINPWLCHNTFMTCLAAGGTFGLLAIVYHFIESFVGIIRRGGLDKIAILTFTFVGLVHGMIDNTFFYILYMIPYIIILSTINKPWNKVM